uniref:Beta-hexosaminidase n=1 Tax=Acrobeloides nanus TaxID=290746 RepID=A0A914DWJ8_9BILA
MTRGEVWPLPWNVTTFNNFTHSVNPGTFRFTSTLVNCDILQQALQRYRKWAFPGYTSTQEVSKTSKIYLAQIDVQVVKGCDNGYPQMGMDESYTLQFNPTSTTAILKANEVWGALRGLESFSQLIFKDSEGNWNVRTTTISDKPRFPHRGILLDCSRHYLSVGIIKRNLDLMAMNKMNVFHWHLTDIESFPYVSTKFPDLSAKGAFTPKHVYTPTQIKSVIDYARLRGIRVVAEFDTPGHVSSWEAGKPGILATCYDDKGKNDTIYPTLLDPTKDENLQFLQQFFDEALNLFPDNYMHFGGDETDQYQLPCWVNNPTIGKWMQDQGMGKNNTALLHYYLSKLVQMVENSRPNASMIFWQEVLDQNVAPSNAIAHVWTGEDYQDSMQEMDHVTKNGHFAIYSSCWYINLIKYGAVWGYVDKNDLHDRGMYYQCNPTDFNGTDAQKELVLGGEACLWGEFVDGTNIISRLWPNAGATAERLWSDLAQTKSVDAAWPRLHEHQCRMMARGYEVQPANGPSFCPDFWDPYPSLD